MPVAGVQIGKAAPLGPRERVGWTAASDPGTLAVRTPSSHDLRALKEETKYFQR